MIDYKRIDELVKWLKEILSKNPVKFSSITPRYIPSDGGVYIISNNSQRYEEFVYVGHSSNLSQRIYTNHFQGDKIASQMKTAIVHFKLAKDLPVAKDYMRKFCVVRFDPIPDYQEREMREGFARALLKPKFSLYKSKEH